jgi:hypothetical protein
VDGAIEEVVAEEEADWDALEAVLLQHSGIITVITVVPVNIIRITIMVNHTVFVITSHHMMPLLMRKSEQHVVG